MLRSRIVPSLLIHQSGLVKSIQFSNHRYVGDPINTVKIFNEKEVDELTIYDIDATANSTIPNMNLLKSISVESRMPLTYGGGINDASTASDIIKLGFEKVSVSSAAIDRPHLIRELSEEVGSQSVVVTIDVKKNKLFSGYTIYTHNGLKKSKLPLYDFCQLAADMGAGEIVINSIDRDGSMQGYDLDLAVSVRESVSCPLTISGGCSGLEDMQSLIDTVGVVGAAAGSFFVFKGQYRAVLISYARPNRLY